MGTQVSLSHSLPFSHSLHFSLSSLCVWQHKHLPEGQQGSEQGDTLCYSICWESLFLSLSLTHTHTRTHTHTVQCVMYYTFKKSDKASKGGGERQRDRVRGTERVCVWMELRIGMVSVHKCLMAAQEMCMKCAWTAWRLETSGFLTVFSRFDTYFAAYFSEVHFSSTLMWVQLWVNTFSWIRIRKGFIRCESLHGQGIYFGRKVHTLNI